MSIKRALIDNFFKSRLDLAGTLPDSALTEVALNEDAKANTGFLRPSSSQSLHLKNVQSRPSSVCSSKSIQLERNAGSDVLIPASLSSAVKKLSVRTLMNYAKLAIDDNSLCLVYSFLMILSIADPKGPAGTVQNTKNKVLPAFHNYLKNAGNLAQLIRKIPKMLKNFDDPKQVLKKSKNLIKVVDLKRLAGFRELYEFVDEATSFGIGLRTGDAGLERRSEAKIKRNIRTESNERGNYALGTGGAVLGKHEKTQSFSAGVDRKADLQGKSKEIIERRKAARPSSISSGEVIPLGGANRSSRTEKFWFESRISKRVQEKLVKFLQGKQGEGPMFRQQVIKDFILTLPSSEVSSSTFKLAELYITKNYR